MKNLILILFIILFALVNICPGQNTEATKLIDYFNKEKNFNGVVLLATDGEIDLVEGVGIGNRQEGTSITAASKFKIASMTKVFTAVLIMKLYEEGKLELTNTIGDYFPSYKGEGKDKVNIHHLLTYSSGISDLLGSSGIQPYKSKKTLDEFIDVYCSGKLEFTPGTKSEYGNTEYIILTKIIENITGKSYRDYVQEIILDPLNMNNAGLVNSEMADKDILSGYTFDDSLNVFNMDESYYPENYFGAGAMYSTAEDLLKFNNAIFKNIILKESTVDRMLEINENLGYTAYGFWGSTGWGSFKEKFYYRTGGILGSTSNWINTMDSKKTIIVLSNTNSANLYELSEKLYLVSIGKIIKN